MVRSPEAVPDHDEEIRLVGRAVNRDAAAFGLLYESHVDRIYRYVYFRVGTTGDAEDLTEIVFLKAWEAIDRYQPRGVPFVAWLYRLAHNLVVDSYRSRRQTVPLDDLTEAEEPGADVMELVEERLDAEEVRAALRTLSPEHQQLIVLRFVEGLSHAEVAEITGKSEGAMRVVQYRALQMLARALQVDGERSKNARRRPAGGLSS
ncbi:MAG TPA: sigma-70 family RNA polymerase sigma factor [Chloroflexota bacterium]|nr:sigma-70 family RNA polymerase sigma factor [Chloroflexota bacterium]